MIFWFFLSVFLLSCSVLRMLIILLLLVRGGVDSTESFAARGLLQWWTPTMKKMEREKKYANERNKKEREMARVFSFLPALIRPTGEDKWDLSPGWWESGRWAAFYRSLGQAASNFWCREFEDRLFLSRTARCLAGLQRPRSCEFCTIVVALKCVLFFPRHTSLWFYNLRWDDDRSDCSRCQVENGFFLSETKMKNMDNVLRIWPGSSL